ncbi:hypothetical protein GH714_043115 [Hevea brasiliensis]|uniref:Potassium channel domain-containing protein n=1 Tax=Hevea brasiliensis TaxID=3981 RepID=A0A6A6K2U9_HEVBR|nr:hypothetical protein GH714_043115 [Hevea brasiliensis]
MEKEPLLSNYSPRRRTSQLSSLLSTLPEHDEVSLPMPLTPSVLKERLIFGPSAASSSDPSPIVEALTLSLNSAKQSCSNPEFNAIPQELPLLQQQQSWLIDPNYTWTKTNLHSYVLDLQENHLLRNVKRVADMEAAGSVIIDVKKGRMRIRMKVALALCVVVLCIGIGVGVMHFVEKLGWLDSFYLSVMSVTNVGYGDRAFRSLTGRIFASIWLLVSTLAVARAFLYLAEARVDKRHRRMAKWVLGQNMTVSEFLAADIDQNGFVSKSEYVIYKLKEMGKVSEKDILQICLKFDKLDTGNCGKITLADLMQSH